VLSVGVTPGSPSLISTTSAARCRIVIRRHRISSLHLHDRWPSRANAFLKLLQRQVNEVKTAISAQPR
jgi:hypothetical protein